MSLRKTYSIIQEKKYVLRLLQRDKLCPFDKQSWRMENTPHYFTRGSFRKVVEQYELNEWTKLLSIRQNNNFPKEQRGDEIETSVLHICIPRSLSNEGETSALDTYT